MIALDVPALQRVVSVSAEQVSSNVAGEVVILNLQNGTYYGLDGIGAFIWNLIQEPQTVLAVRDALLEEYDVSAEQCEHDLIALFGKLAGAGLIEVRDAGVPAA